MRIPKKLLCCLSGRRSPASEVSMLRSGAPAFRAGVSMSSYYSSSGASSLCKLLPPPTPTKRCCRKLSKLRSSRAFCCSRTRARSSTPLVPTLDPSASRMESSLPESFACFVPFACLNQALPPFLDGPLSLLPPFVRSLPSLPPPL